MIKKTPTSLLLLKISAALIIFGAVCSVFLCGLAKLGVLDTSALSIKTGQKTATLEPDSRFVYTFNSSGILNEADKMVNSDSPYWWLDSGGLFLINNGVGMTIQGDLSENSKWQTKYLNSNPIDTDNGLHPQNIFRLVARGIWTDYQQEVKFKINKVNLSQSPNRNESNGVLFFIRYIDGDNLYYAGIRVDGQAVVKKKKQGIYYTLAGKNIFFNGAEYDRLRNANLMPTGRWAAIKSEIRNISDGSVIIRFYVNETGQETGWKQVLEAVDNGASFGGSAFIKGGNAGIRSDFMDIEFDDYKITPIE